MPEKINLEKPDSDPKCIDEEYIKLEVIVRKRGINQEDTLNFIRRCNIFGIGNNRIVVEEIAVTGIEPANENAEIDEFLKIVVADDGKKSTQRFIDDTQDAMAQKFFEQHPMWFIVTNCPICGTPNKEFPCKRCGYEC